MRSVDDAVSITLDVQSPICYVFFLSHTALRVTRFSFFALSSFLPFFLSYTLVEPKTFHFWVVSSHSAGAGYASCSSTILVGAPLSLSHNSSNRTKLLTLEIEKPVGAYPSGVHK